MQVKREDVLSALENAMVAVTSNAVLEQSDTFVFADGELVTFDGEICTRQDSPFGSEIEGSIIASDFFKILQRFPDENIKVEKKKGEIIVKGKKRTAGIKLMADILLPYQDVPVDGKFKKVPEELKNIIEQATCICGKDETVPKTTHIHLTSDRIESTDSFRVFRADIETGLKTDVLVHANSLSKICKKNIKKIAMSKSGWMHFVTDDGLRMSVLCSADEFYKKEMIDKLLNISGEEVELPDNFIEILSRAEIMDSSSMSTGGWNSQVSITIADNTIKVTSRKDEGWFRETQKCEYEGPEMTFSIHPVFLKELVGKTNKVVISDRQIKVDVDNIHFTAALEVGEDS